MSMLVPAVLSALVVYATPANAYCSYYYGCGRSVSGGGIAGIVIGAVVFFLLLLTCCMMGMRRRRTYYNSGGQGTWYPVSRGGIFPSGPQRDAEAGNGGQQAGWNGNASAANRGGPGAVPPPYEAAKAPQYAPVSKVYTRRQHKLMSF
ncbi:uncharacterized protein B0H18DRAFT_1004387 [Fomitopsis serialis]|uniref:uncharacterized protein n=1 Tax=Fomitopsis serialis TaxID=139415 RepID=UPI002008C1E4|nr:uncharacterized protein B0H18DRAFT_1004387 [Neoantrodia serialis]KAH9926900.1 hypothetical protein B0H18DRAFT_1004387 [Neoantrodia serialis]